MVRALLCELHECDCGFNVLGGFAFSGCLDISSAASSGWPFTRQRILHFLQLFWRPDALEVGEGTLSKLFAGKVCGHLVFSSESSFATGARAQVRPTWPGFGETWLSCTSMDFRCACWFLKRTIQLVCSVIVHPTSSMTPSLRNERVHDTLSRLRLGVGRSYVRSIPSISLCTRTFPSTSHWTPGIQTNTPMCRQNFTRPPVIPFLVQNICLECPIGRRRTSFTCLRVTCRMLSSTWACQSGCNHPYFWMRPLPIRAFGMGGTNVQGIRIALWAFAVSGSVESFYGILLEHVLL